MAIWRKVRLGALAAACIGGAAVACRQLVGIGDDPPRADTSACGLSYATSDCAACVASSCCSASSSCATDAVCAAYEGCLAACAGDAACRARCELDHAPGTRSDVPALDACLAASCASACNLGCGAVAESFTPPDAAPSCESCLVTNACDLERACAGSGECEQYVRCINACSTFGCQQSCGPDAGVVAFAQLGAVISGSCANACEYGRNWLCVGHVSWPSPSGPTTRLTAIVTDLVGGHVEPGAVVQPCSAVDQTCESPFADAATTDDAGAATFEIPQAATIPNGFYLLVSPPADDGGAGAFVTTLSYLRSPLTEATKQVSAPVITQRDLAGLYKDFGLDAGPGLGSVRGQVFDCNLRTAPGATVAVKTSNGVPVPVFYGVQLAETSTTDQQAFVEIGNVPPGFVEITVTPPGGGAPSSKTTVISRAGAFTAVSLLPTP